MGGKRRLRMAPTESEIGNTVPFGTKVSKFLSHACCGIIFYPNVELLQVGFFSL